MLNGHSECRACASATPRNRAARAARRTEMQKHQRATTEAEAALALAHALITYWWVSSDTVPDHVRLGALWSLLEYEPNARLVAVAKLAHQRQCVPLTEAVWTILAERPDAMEWE
jgi:hypothetical protein